MNIKWIIRTLMLSLIASTAMIRPEIEAQISSEQAQESQNEAISTENISPKKLESIEKAKIVQLNNLQEFDNIAQELAMLVSNGNIKNIDKKKVNQILSETRSLIQYLQSITASTKDLSAEQQIQVAFGIQQMCDAISAYLDNAIKTNLKGLEPFDPTQFIKRSTPIDTANLSSKDLKAKFRKTELTIISLKNKINLIGLTWYNLIARKINEKIIMPCNKYHVADIAKMAVPTALFAGLAVMYYGNLVNPNSIIYYDGIDKPDAFKDKGYNPITKLIAMANAYASRTFGEPLVHNQLAGGDLTISENIAWNEKHKSGGDFGAAKFGAESNNMISNLPRGTLPSLIHASTQFISNNVPLVALAGYALWNAYKEIWQGQVSPWISMKTTKAWNHLLGGTYEENFVKGYWDMSPTVTFDNMTGNDDIKEELSTLIQFLENPEQLTKIGLQSEKGWLLTGPTRAGKSFSIECLFGEIHRRMPGKYRFWKLDAAAVKYFGIKTIFEMAKEAAPVILYIDEIHLLLEKPTDDTTRTLLHDFLTTMESTLKGNMDSAKPVILFTATNQEWLLPDAVRANGRLGKEIRIEYPNLQYRKQFIMHELAKMALDIDQFDIETLGIQTDGKSFEDISAIIRVAATKTRGMGHPLTQEALERSLNSELRDIIMDDRKELPENEKRILASHFAGRALCLLELDGYRKLDTVTIKAIKTDTKGKNGDPQKTVTYGALFTKSLHDTIHMNSRDETINEIKTLIAGFIAEELLLGSCGYKCHPEDNKKAYQLIQDIVFEGLDKDSLAKNVRDQLLDKSYALLSEYKREVTEMLKNNRENLEVISNALMYVGILTDREITAVLEAVKKLKDQPANQTDQQGS